MSDEELEQDDLDVSEDDDGEELDATDDGDASDDEGTDSERATPTPKKAKAKAVELEELPSLEAKQRERDELARAMEEYLARGGRVQEVEPNVVADPPKKPDSKYGSRPI
ncbi:transcriptional regulator SutA [Stutzerimonas nitrititolerans]|uniref:transcriptional regulator SutA n=1 Tax=Stutzerimonas nitrititolerans TaxID=2482751 RepID=UPI00289C9E9D|nr:transcriptional regulator SutA [Stutzerimonas nitrititolerans]